MVCISQIKYSAAIYTLGCKVNFYESEAISESLASRGVEMRSFDDICDIYIINTCTVTADSDRKALRVIRRAVRLNPNAFIAVTGCLAQRQPDLVNAIEGVSLVVGNERKISVADRILEGLEKRRAAESTKAEISVLPFSKELEPSFINAFERTRAYVKIEDGCSSRCAYCIIPSVRGPVRSKTREAVSEEVRALVRGGCREVVITGIEISSYQYDITKLLAELDNIDGLERIRLGSLDPFFISADMSEALGRVKKLCPHFHISLQSGSSEILGAMRRKYNADTAMNNIMKLKSVFPGCSLFADVIVGFPGESDYNFNQTVEFIKAVRFLHLHIFPYSRREGTEAANMKNQVPQPVKKARASLLAAIQADIKRGILDEFILSGQKANVLFETYKDGILKGHSDNFIEFECPSDRNMRGETGTVIPVCTDGEVITGYLISSSSLTKLSSPSS